MLNNEPGESGWLDPFCFVLVSFLFFFCFVFFCFFFVLFPFSFFCVRGGVNDLYGEINKLTTTTNNY